VCKILFKTIVYTGRGSDAVAGMAVTIAFAILKVF
jgi:hypothetical protein